MIHFIFASNTGYCFSFKKENIFLDFDTVKGIEDDMFVKIFYSLQ